MSEPVESLEEWCLDRDRIGWVRVRYEQGLVTLVGYGEKLDLRCEEALRLLSWLQQHRALLQDRATQWYDCRECGSTHPRSVPVCPLLTDGAGRTSSS